MKHPHTGEELIPVLKSFEKLAIQDKRVTMIMFSGDDRIYVTDKDHELIVQAACVNFDKRHLL